jgi:hypothetical protein
VKQKSDDRVYRMLDGLRDELKPLLDRLLDEAQGTPAFPTATEINELLIARGIVPRQAIVAKVPRLSERWPGEIRRAVKDAERQVKAQWRGAGIAGTKLPLDHKARMLDEVLAAARKQAREEVRARHLAEEAAVREAPLPPHISRLAADSVPRETIDGAAGTVQRIAQRED